MSLRLRLFTIIISAIALSAAASDRFMPSPRPNPWADDYRPVSAMEHFRAWGTYNVHDPSCLKIGDRYYMYSTDAIYRENRKEALEKGVPLGFIQIRSSDDLVNWRFEGWAFKQIPEEGVKWVKDLNDGRGATNVWAPFIVDCGNGTFRLYYCVSAFGKKTSYIGLAEATDPKGPWVHKGCVVKTDHSTPMNAIDPTVITDGDGRQWMHYGSYFGGLYCIELDPATGFPKTPGDLGHLVARRANYRHDNLEAPEIVFNPARGEYLLFGSYDPLMTTYNVRVARSSSAQGPFTDIHGLCMADTTDNFPILTAPYRFDNHPGWVGTGHCCVFDDGQGHYFMAHQGRYASDPGMMDLHVRRLFFTPSGWPVVSPERYAGVAPRKFAADDLQGKWEIVRVAEPHSARLTEAGQIRWGEGDMMAGEWNISAPLTLRKGGKLSTKTGLLPTSNGQWAFNPESQLMSLTIDGETITDLIVFAGHDWELAHDTVLFTGLDSRGRSVWGKRVK